MKIEGGPSLFFVFFILSFRYVCFYFFILYLILKINFYFFCPNPSPRSPPSKVSGRGEEPLKFPEKPERTRRGRLKNPQMNPQKSPRRPEGKAISSPILNPPKRTPRTRIGRLKTPGFQSLLFAPYHFLFIFTFFLDWNPY